MGAQVTVSNDITLVTLHNAPADMDFIATIFEDIATLNIDIDMISLSPVQGSTMTVSFTIKDDDLMALLGYTSRLKAKNIKPIVIVVAPVCKQFLHYPTESATALPPGSVHIPFS